MSNKGYAVTIGALQESLLAEMSTLRSGKSTPDRAREVTRISNSIRELLGAEVEIQKLTLEMEKAGKKLEMGHIYIGDPATK